MEEIVTMKEITKEEAIIQDLTQAAQDYLDIYLKKFIHQLNDDVTRKDADIAASLFLKLYLGQHPTLKIHYNFKIAAVRTETGLSYEVQIDPKK